MAKKTIILKNYLNNFVEYVAAAAITPGHFVELASATTVQVHSTAGGNILPMVAIENALEGEGIADAYAADDRVRCWIPQRGDEVYGLLSDGESVSVGDFLESAGDGTLQKHVVDSFSASESVVVSGNQIVAQALEAVDMSDSSGADPSGRIKVRIV